MSPGTATGTLLGALAACVLTQGFFVAAEVAVTACDRARLRQRALAGSRRAKLTERLVAEPQITLATTLLGANLASIVGVILLGVNLQARGLHPLWAAPMLVPPILVFGHLLPKGLVQTNPDRWAELLTPAIAAWSYALRPLVFLIGGFATAVTRVARTDRKKAFVTRDELALLIESEPETDKPQITADEREMIANVFELSEYTVRELMVPLSEVTALPEDSDLAEAAREVADKQHSRMPIYRSRVDDVVGVVHVFDLLSAASDPAKDGKPGTVAELANPPTYVPETMRASELLRELQAEGQHLAIVVDEYGGAVGIVTIEDLLEIIVGDIDDEYDREPSPIKVERPGVWRVTARTSVTRINAELDLDLQESDDYETVAGLLIDRFRRIPEVGESVSLATATIEVVAASDRAVEAVRITRKRK
ncbi:MAG: hemolysin family protein [Kofleriaceae bacterium]